MKKFLARFKKLRDGVKQFSLFKRGKNKKSKKSASTNIFYKVGRFITPKYFRDSWKEIKKVTWPSRKESLRLTFAVAIFTLFFTLITALADQGFSWLIERIVL